MDKDNIIDNFVECLNIDEVAAWANLLGVEVNPPALDDMYPDWESELRVEIGDVIRAIGKKGN